MRGYDGLPRRCGAAVGAGLDADGDELVSARGLAVGDLYGDKDRAEEGVGGALVLADGRDVGADGNDEVAERVQGPGAGAWRAPSACRR